MFEDSMKPRRERVVGLEARRTDRGGLEVGSLVLRVAKVCLIVTLEAWEYREDITAEHAVELSRQANSVEVI